MFQKFIANGYIVGLCKGASNGNITEEEYNAILSVIRNKPAPPENYDYKLHEDLTWEPYELPVVPPEDEDATEEDYLSALSDLGVK